jgi:hypothetical protein
MPFSKTKYAVFTITPAVTALQKRRLPVNQHKPIHQQTPLFIRV